MREPLGELRRRVYRRSIVKDIGVIEAIDELLMEIFSRHHFMIVQASAECLVASELRHHALRRLC